MVSALVSRSSGRGSSPGWGRCVVFLDTLTVPDFTLSRCIYGYQQTLCWGQPCDRLAFHPGGSRNTPSYFMLLKPR